MTADSQQVSHTGHTGSERWADERIQQRRSEPQKVIRRPPAAGKHKRSSWWPVFWLLCLIVFTLLMILRQMSTSPTVDVANIQWTSPTAFFEDISLGGISSLFSSPSGNSLDSPSDNLSNRIIDQPAEQLPKSQEQITQDEAGPFARVRTRPTELFQPLGIFAETNQAANSGDADSRVVVADSFRDPSVSLASALVEEQWVMDFLPDGSGIYRMRVWPESIAWTSLGHFAMPNHFRLETTMQINSLVSEGYGGFLARFQDDGNYYIFVVDGDGNYQVALRRDGVWSTVQQWTNSPAIHFAGGKENLIALEDTDDRLRFYANGALLSEFAPALPTGLTGFVAGTRSTRIAEVDYFGLTLYELP